MACTCLSRRVFMAGFAALTAAPAMAQTPACSPARPTYAVRKHPLQAAVDYSLPTADLARVRDTRDGLFGTRTQHGQAPAGLTLADFKLDWSMTATSIGNGRQICVAPERVEVDLRMERHRIYIARDVTRTGTCRRDVVLEHESRHVRINLEFVEDAKTRIERALAEHVPQLGTLSGSANAALAVFRNRLRRPIEGAFQSALSVANARHAEMDTREAYARDWARCA
jgi:hypothetical protein